MLRSRKQARKKSKHRYSTYVLIAFSVFLFAGITAALTSEDLDDICNKNDHILYRYGGNWSCAFLGNVIEFHNITVVNNITVLDDTVINATNDAEFASNVTLRNGNLHIGDTDNSNQRHGIYQHFGAFPGSPGTSFEGFIPVNAIVYEYHSTVESADYHISNDAFMYLNTSQSDPLLGNVDIEGCTFFDNKLNNCHEIGRDSNTTFMKTSVMQTTVTETQGFKVSQEFVDGDKALANNSMYLHLDSNPTEINITLPVIDDGHDGTWYMFKVVDFSSPITITANGTDTIDGSSTYSFTVDNEFLQIVGDGVFDDWNIVSQTYDVPAGASAGGGVQSGYITGDDWSRFNSSIIQNDNATLGNLTVSNNLTVVGNSQFGVDGTGGDVTFNTDTSGYSMDWDADGGGAATTPYLHMDIVPGHAAKYIDISGTDSASQTTSNGILNIEPTYTGTISTVGANIMYFKVTDNRVKSSGFPFSRILQGEMAGTVTLNGTVTSDSAEVVKMSGSHAVSMGDKARPELITTTFQANLGSTVTMAGNGNITVTHTDFRANPTLFMLDFGVGEVGLNYIGYDVIPTLNQLNLKSGNFTGFNYNPTLGGFVMDEEYAFKAARAGISLKSDYVRGSYSGGHVLFGADEDAIVGFDGNSLIVNSSTTNVTGDLEWYQKDYGQMTYHNDTTPLTVSIGDTTNYFPITGMNNSLGKWMSSNSSHFTVTRSGLYRIASSISFGGQASQEYQISVLVNDVDITWCEAHRMMGTGGDVGNAGINCLYELSDGDTVGIGIQDETGPATNADVYSIQFNLERID